MFINAFLVAGLASRIVKDRGINMYYKELDICWKRIFQMEWEAVSEGSKAIYGIEEIFDRLAIIFMDKQG